MPLNRPPLASDVIAKIEKWIAGGARFDGRDQNMSLARLAAVVKAQSSTHAELSSDRAVLAGKNWHLMLPDAPADHTESEHFVIYGNVGAPVLADIDKEAEAQVVKLQKTLKIPTGEPLIKGRMTIYVFARRTRLRRDWPHAGKPRNSGRLAGPLAIRHCRCLCRRRAAVEEGRLFARRPAGRGDHRRVRGQPGDDPHWFADGSGKAVAAKINPKDSRVRTWENRLMPALAKLKKPSDILENKLSAADEDALVYGFVKALMSKAGPYNSLLSALHGGTPFEAAFKKAYGASPKDAVETWVARGGKR